MIACISPSSLSFILVSLRDNVRVEVPRDLSYPSLLVMREAGEPTESKFVCLILESMQGFFFFPTFKRRHSRQLLQYPH